VITPAVQLPCCLQSRNRRNTNLSGKFVARSAAGSVVDVEPALRAEPQTRDQRFWTRKRIIEGIVGGEFRSLYNQSRRDNSPSRRSDTIPPAKVKRTFFAHRTSAKNGNRSGPAVRGYYAQSADLLLVPAAPAPLPVSSMPPLPKHYHKRVKMSSRICRMSRQSRNVPSLAK
jgi:hypothetical protein